MHCLNLLGSPTFYTPHPAVVRLYLTHSPGAAPIQPFLLLANGDLLVSAVLAWSRSLSFFKCAGL